MRHTTTAARFAVTALLGWLLPAAAWAAGEPASLLLNGGAENGKGELPSVWFAARVPAKGLRMYRATDRAYAGKASLAIANEHKYDQVVANNWAQTLGDVPAGRVVRLSAAIRTEQADAANVCLQCWSLDGKSMLGFISTPVFRGDQDWVLTRSQPLAVPAETAFIIVRAALTGTGKAWFDEIAVTVAQDAPPKPAAAPPKLPAPAEDLAKIAPGRIVRVMPIAKDCMVLSYIPRWAHGNVDNIAVANNDGGVRTLLAWPKVPAEEAARPDRRYVLALYSRRTTLKPPAGRIHAYEILTDWPERTSWTAQPKYADTPAATFRLVPGMGWKLFDITDLLRAQAKARRKSHGLLLRFDREDRVAAGPPSWSGYAFASREGAGEWLKRRPVVLVIKPAAGATTRPATQPYR